MMRFYVFRMFVLSLLLIAIAVGGVAAATSPLPSDKGARIEQTIWRGRPAYRLTDGVTEAIVVPSVSRVMSYSFVGGENVLYAPDPAVPFDNWMNWGGVRTWLAPQFEWRLLAGPVSPDPAWSQSAARAVKLGRSALALYSPISKATGLLVVRTYSIDHDGRFVITQSLKQTGGQAFNISLWNITQIRTPDAIYLPVNPASIYKNDYFGFNTDCASHVDRPSQALLRLTPCPTAYKVGVDSLNAVAIALFGDTALIVRGSKVGGDYPDGALGHGFPVEVWNDMKERGSYDELELLSPLQVLRSGSKMYSKLTMQLQRGAASASPDDRLAWITSLL